MIVRLTLAASVLLASSLARAQPSVREQVDGTWTLESSVQTDADGSSGPSPLYGKGGIGWLLVDKSSDDMMIILDEVHAGSMNAYTGKYRVNEAEGYLIYDSVFDRVPNDPGARLKRYVTVQGDVLTLRTPSPKAGIKECVVTWKRFSE